jgi:hypothetical protein
MNWPEQIKYLEASVSGSDSRALGTGPWAAMGSDQLEHSRGNPTCTLALGV